ncbi:MAG: homoserine dehydrogenase [Candidatus Omnitrophota bacterium]
MMIDVNVGLIGYGNVGQGVVKLLKKKRALLQDKYHIQVNVRGICDLQFRKKKPRGLGKKTILTSDARKLLEDPDTAVIIELIGGLHPAKEFVLQALKNGKHVITANKALIAQYGKTLFKAAEKYQRNIYFETSVLAGVPLIKTLTEGLAGNDIHAVYGIINGTCNYVLSEMSSNNLSFENAVKKAQANGFAETDPTLDINGMDAAYKLAILTYLAFGKFVTPKSIHTEGITHISHQDIQFAEELGLTIKLLAIAKNAPDGIEARVHPTLIQQDHPLAAINGVLNAALLEADPLGEILLSGEGAGQYAAASGVMSDLINLISRHDGDPQNYIGNFYHEAPDRIQKKIDSISTKFYLRIMAEDKPGVLSKISGILARYGISISSVSQKAQGTSGAIPVVMLTETATEKKVRQALDRIHKLPVVKKRPVAIRIENLT